MSTFWQVQGGSANSDGGRWTADGGGSLAYDYLYIVMTMQTVDGGRQVGRRHGRRRTAVTRLLNLTRRGR